LKHALTPVPSETTPFPGAFPLRLFPWHFAFLSLRSIDSVHLAPSTPICIKRLSIHDCAAFNWLLGHLPSGFNLWKPYFPLNINAVISRFPPAPQCIVWGQFSSNLFFGPDIACTHSSHSFSDGFFWAELDPFVRVAIPVEPA